MESQRDLAGTEFDWFAVDQDGNFALFATAGAGPVPSQVHNSLERHCALADDIPVSGWGTNEVWNSYAQVGLFAYDWHDGLQAYVRVAEPRQPLDAHFRASLQASPLPRLSVFFASHEKVPVSVDA